MDKEKELLISRNTVARLLGVCTMTIDRWSDGKYTPEGWPKPFKIGRRVFFVRAEIEAWVERYRAAAMAAE